jgi:hypothetical protein
MVKSILAFASLSAFLQVAFALEPAYLVHLEVKTDNDWNSGGLSTSNHILFINKSILMNWCHYA